MRSGPFARGTRRLRVRIALVIVGATTGAASLAALFFDGHLQLMLVLTALSASAHAAEWGLR